MFSLMCVCGHSPLFVVIHFVSICGDFFWNRESGLPRRRPPLKPFWHTNWTKFALFGWKQNLNQILAFGGYDIHLWAKKKCAFCSLFCITARKENLIGDPWKQLWLAMKDSCDLFTWNKCVQLIRDHLWRQLFSLVLILWCLIFLVSKSFSRSFVVTRAMNGRNPCFWSFLSSENSFKSSQEPQLHFSAKIFHAPSKEKPQTFFWCRPALATKNH